MAAVNNTYEKRAMKIIESLLNKAKKVSEQAEVFWVTSQNTDASFEANRLKSVETRQGRYLSLRIVKDGRIGYSSTNKIDNVDEILNMALDVAKFGAKAEFELPSLQNYPKATREKISLLQKCLL